MKRSIIATLMVAALAVAACEDKTAKPEDPASKNSTTGATATTPTTTATTPAPAPVVIADSDLSTPADFEESAEKAITKQNYKAEIATLEKDLGKE